MLPVIALVGRPNVGKSTLFNRLTRSRDALVASFPGLTRDRQYGKGALGERDYLVVDTGGLSGVTSGIDAPMAQQAMNAVGEADLILFMVDARDGRTAGDEAIATSLRRQDLLSNKETAEQIPVLLVVNKIDGLNQDVIAGEFHSLGFGEPAYISATNGHGVRYLVDERMLPSLPDPEPEEVPDEAGIRFAVVGRPNVGKSTLVNRILGEERVVVFDEAGTTRDSIYIPFTREGESYTIIDTAGVRRRGRVNEKIEKFSIIKTLDAIASAHVVLVMMDAREGVVEQDLHLLGHVLEAGRALVLVVNKWDGLDSSARETIKRELERRLTFINFAKLHFVSALHGSGVGNLFKSIVQAHASATRKIKTADVNQILEQAVIEHQPPMVRGRRIKLRYAHLGGSNPPIIVIHGNQTDSVPASYQRYLEHRFIAALGLEGTPIRLQFKTSDNPFKGRRNQLTRRQVTRKKRLVSHVKKQERKKKRR
ncbi:MAG: ribosome biogenesis GTPase Der [Proteobacteria bacterium]|jgi:GTP-binding protein|nr:ribosome biogenesis GTPase Der [Pseudomonadota bacterium]MDA1302116.1 ribosome biogenesis GTPase Der [Pseudomonadota bacterium]